MAAARWPRRDVLLRPGCYQVQSSDRRYTYIYPQWYHRLRQPIFSHLQVEFPSRCRQQTTLRHQTTSLHQTTTGTPIVTVTVKTCREFSQWPRTYTGAHEDSIKTRKGPITRFPMTPNMNFEACIAYQHLLLSIHLVALLLYYYCVLLSCIYSVKYCV
jgi:hypothetical protein